MRHLDRNHVTDHIWERGLYVSNWTKCCNAIFSQKHYAQCHDQEDELAVSYSYGQYLYHRGSFSGASQIFCNIQVAAEDFVTEVEYADAACMYQQEKYSSTATKAAEIYDSIVQQCPSLAPTYDDERTMVRSETNDDNVMEGCQMAAALVLQAASYFKQGQGAYTHTVLNVSQRKSILNFHLFEILFAATSL